VNPGIQGLASYLESRGCARRNPSHGKVNRGPPTQRRTPREEPHLPPPPLAARASSVASSGDSEGEGGERRWQRCCLNRLPSRPLGATQGPRLRKSSLLFTYFFLMRGKRFVSYLLLLLGIERDVLHDPQPPPPHTTPLIGSPSSIRPRRHQEGWGTRSMSGGFDNSSVFQ
jgi:hypothetical protein